MNSLTHQTLVLPIGKIRYMRNATRSPNKILCLHGWLDNRASFLPMLPYLDDFECIAVDITGHGESCHRDISSLNHYIDYVRDIKFILNALNWQHCHIIGHSMGGSIGLLTASAFPEAIKSLTMIDTLYPINREAKDTPAMLRKSLNQFVQWDASKQRVFPSFDAALKARLAGSPFPQRQQDAKLIMQAATEKTENGYRLRSDARLKFNSPLMLNTKQIRAFIRSVEQPVQAILGSEGMMKNRKGVRKNLTLFNNIQVNEIEGGHHVHMENPHAVSKLCAQFIQSSLMHTDPA